MINENGKNGQQILAVSDQTVYFGTSVNDIFKACVKNGPGENLIQVLARKYSGRDQLAHLAVLWGLLSFWFLGFFFPSYCMTENHCIDFMQYLILTNLYWSTSWHCFYLLIPQLCILHQKTVSTTAGPEILLPDQAQLHHKWI